MSNPWIRFAVPLADGILALCVHSKTGKIGALSFTDAHGQLLFPQVAPWNQSAYNVLREQAVAFRSTLNK